VLRNHYGRHFQNPVNSCGLIAHWSERKSLKMKPTFLAQNPWVFDFSKLFLAFVDPPSIVSRHVNKTVNETQDLRLVCDATGNPQPHISWTKGPDRTPIKSVDGALILNNVNKSDTGVYQCRASNGIGSDAMVSSHLTVNCKFHIQLVTKFRFLW